MLFSLNRHRPLFTVNPVLNDYVKQSNPQYIRNIIKDVEYTNKKRVLFGENIPKFNVYDNNCLYDQISVINSSILFLSLTTILYYFYSNKN